MNCYFLGHVAAGPSSFEEYLDLDFSIDVMKAGKGREIVDVLAVPETSMKIAEAWHVFVGWECPVV